MADKFRFRVSGILSSTVDDGEVRMQLGDPSDPSGGFDADAPVWAVDGFISRPNPPDDDGQCALAYSVYQGNQNYVVSTKDNRYVDAVGELEPGDRAVITNADARWFLKQASSAIVSYTVNQKTDESMICDMNGADGEVRIFNGTVGILLRNDGNDKSLILTTGDSTILIDADGVFINGNHFGCNTNGGNFGTLGLVPPIPPAFSVLVGPSGMASVPSTKFTMVT